MEKNLHYGRFNESGKDGRDVYDIKEKAVQHMRSLMSENCGAEGKVQEKQSENSEIEINN